SRHDASARFGVRLPLRTLLPASLKGEADRGLTNREAGRSITPAAVRMRVYPVRSRTLHKRSGRFTKDIAALSRSARMRMGGMGMDRVETGFIVTAITSSIVLVSSIVWLAMM